MRKSYILQQIDERNPVFSVAFFLDTLVNSVVSDQLFGDFRT